MRKIILNLFFLGLIVSTLTGLAFKKSAFFKESPFLPPLPKFSAKALIDREFYKGLESYLNFRNPLRRHYIKSNSWLDIHLFNTSPTRKIHKGLNGWLYYRPAIKSFLKADCKKKEKALQLARVLHRLERRLKKAGKRFVFIVAPDKATIYPEYMGGVREANGCNKSFYDLFLEALKRYPVRGFIRLDRKFMEAKKTNLLYYTGGTHWNDRGAALAGKLILKKLSTSDVSYRLPHIDFREKRVLSESALMLSVNLYELAFVADTIRFETDVKTDNIEPLAFFPSEWFLLRTKARRRSAGPLLPKTIIYRDSFMTAPLKFLKGSFEEIYARWSHVFPENIKVEAKEVAAAKIVIIEIVEKDLPKLQLRPELVIKQTRMQASLANSGTPGPNLTAR